MPVPFKHKQKLSFGDAQSIDQNVVLVSLCFNGTFSLSTLYIQVNR